MHYKKTQEYWWWSFFSNHSIHLMLHPYFFPWLFKRFQIHDDILYPIGWKHEIKSYKVCGQSLKPIFQKIEKLPWECYISKNSFNFLNKFLYFQSYNYKIFMKIHHVLRVLLYVLSAQEKHVNRWFFCFKNPFSLLNVHQIITILLWTLIYSTRRDSYVQNIQKTKIHIHFYILILKHP